MQPLLQALDKEFALSALSRQEPPHVIRSARLAVHSGGLDGNHIADFCIGTDPGKTHRIIPRSGEGTSHPVRPRGQDQLGGDVSNTEPARAGGGIFRENLHAEKLIEKPNISRDDH